MKHVAGAALAAAVLAIAGCSGTESGADHTPMVFADGAVNHPISVAPEYRSLRLAYAPGAGLNPSDENRLDAFVADYAENGSGAISIAAPQGSGDAVTNVSRHLVALGVPPSRILVAPAQGAGPGSDIEIGYLSYAAHTDTCGKWTRDANDTDDNLPMPDFGCATQHNIAAMVSNPRDLVEPRPLGPSDTTRRDTITKQYETGQVTAAQKTQEQQGNVSDVGTGGGGN